MILQSILTSEILRAIKLLPNAINNSSQATKMKMSQNMLPSVTKWYYQNELPSFQKVKTTMLLHWVVTSELPRAIKLLPNAIKHSTQATKMKMCQNMLPSVMKWYYQNELILYNLCGFFCCFILFSYWKVWSWLRQGQAQGNVRLWKTLLAECNMT